MTRSGLTPLGAGQWRLTGVLDFTTVTPLVAEGAAVLADPSARDGRELEIDLAGVVSANSAGLALLLEWLEMAQASGARLTYRHLPDSLERIATVSNLKGILPLAD